MKAKTSSIDAKGAGADPETAGSTYVDIRLTDSNGKGIAGKVLTVVSTRALLGTVDDGAMRTITVGGLTENAPLGLFTGSGSLAGSVTTSADGDTQADIDTAGYARVLVTGAGSPGVSTITVTMGELTGTAEIVLHGVVKTISAVVEQGAIAVGGKTRIVVTALDAGDNPVANQNANVKTKDGVTPPERLAKKVETSNTVNKDGGTKGSLTDKGDIPACGIIAVATVDNPDTDANEAGATSSGTNADGKCVIEVSAPGDDTATTTDDAARGTHTIVVVASNDGGDGPKGVNEATVEVQVGGAPATIESDAPERLDPSGELTVNITVLDDEGVRVGRVDIEVDRTAGDGKIISADLTSTSDGRTKFTYLAPSTQGVVNFLVRTRDDAGKVTAQLPIIIAIAAEAPPEPPVVVEPVAPVEPETPDAAIVGFNPSAGQSGVVTFTNLSSIDDALGLIGCGDQSGTTVSLTLMDGSSAIYAVGAPDFANRGFTDNVEFPIAFAAAYVSCP